MRLRKFGFVGATFAVAVVLASSAEAAGGSSSSSSPSKDECVDAHGRGQDLRDKGQLVRARQAFVTCAQNACPSVVQSDCARLNEEISHLLPTVTFGARDSSGADLAVTSVYVDDVLMTTRLDDGRTYELDPGKHIIRYAHDGHETTNRVVLNQGEKGRVLVATFPSATPARVAASSTSSESFEPVIEPKRSGIPLVFAGIGAAAAITGGVLTAVGLTKVPASCSMSTNECATSSSDPAIGQAKSGVGLANIGMSVGVGGLLVLAGGLVWYWVQPARDPREGSPSKRVDARRGAIDTLTHGLQF